MTTPGEAAARHTGLDAGSLAHLQRLLGSWGVLSDLSFSDLLLVAPVAGTDGARLVVLGQIRPTTWATLLRADLVGQMVEAADWPVVGESMASGSVASGFAVIPVPVHARLTSADPDSRDTGEVPAVPDTAQLECIPVRHGGDPIAVVVRVAPLEDRRPGRLERVYRDLYTRLAGMVAAGDFPFAGEEYTTEDAPRVGDGLVLIDPDGFVRYTSPNAMSALHRMGVTDVVEGRRLSDLGIDDTAVDYALRAGCPVTEEVERRPDVIVMLQCTPLLEQGTVTGAMVLLRDVTDLRRLDRLLLSKDAAIREVHHRVKNNLQTISSLLRLQARRLEPGKGQEELREAERRVRSIALVHEILSREPGDQVPFDEIVGSLVRMAEDSVVSQGDIVIRVTGDVGEVAADVATPLAVVLAELLQNAVEHAFPSIGADADATDGAGAAPGPGDTGPEAIGHVDLVLVNDGEHLTLQVRDDGCGLPPGFDIDRTTSLGLSIVRDLVTSQLDGSISMQSTLGTLVTIVLPVRDPAGGSPAP
ncbi:MAG TPA: histidine kinase N-terminal domain-containing protein [Acidimicrobiales bacterium]|nr:histidine kinase N-terminal domain-containing protein [Acidimicrobiales bacterium]